MFWRHDKISFATLADDKFALQKERNELSE
jgi:hypothetical protein